MAHLDEVAEALQLVDDLFDRADQYERRLLHGVAVHAESRADVVELRGRLRRPPA